MFTAAEATSIWEEVVTCWKDEILHLEQDGDAEPGHVFALLAARTPLPRQHLEMWDASARAWLRAEDKAMEKRHKQLLLIINHSNISVDHLGITYLDVTSACIRAMTAVDKLVGGVPESIADGAVLVDISAWHFYPDMMALGEKSTYVKQK